MRHSDVRPALVVLLLLTGCTTAVPEECGDGASCAAVPVCAPVDEGRARENAPPEVARVAEADADLVLVVTNAGRPAERVVVRADGALLLDALLPPGGDYCGHEPVLSWAYGLPDEPVQVDVRGAGQTGRVVVDGAGPRRWVTVMTQEGFPLYVRATDTAPAFG